MIEITKIDLHMHSTVSDGTDTPAELLSNVREAGICMFALTDHDSIKGCASLKAIRSENDPVLLNGVEFSCRDELGRYHILGYDYDLTAKPIKDVVELSHALRIRKFMARIRYIRDKFGFTLPEEDIQSLLTLDNPGMPHIANLMVHYGYAPSREKAIKQYLNHASSDSEYTRPEAAIQGILGSGGIPVLAHPAFGDGDQLIIGQDMDKRLKRLIGFGLQGVEAFYSGFTPELTAETLGFAEKYGLYVTAGSDYHGKNKHISLGSTHLSEAAAIPDGLVRFLERVSQKQ
ncbi:MAG: PHP domain-containing protein [Clostridia bacterium]|nr:PHP domain-containing protein [Clostridia bacterium]